MKELALAHLTYPEVAARLGGGGRKVAVIPVGSTEAHGPHLPLCTDSLIGAAVACSFAAERLLPYRREWNTPLGDAGRDTIHAVVNETFVLASVAVIPALAALNPLPGWWPASAPFGVQVLLAVVIADFGITTVHLASHKIGWMWRLHAVHHSAKHMDWMAGSRQHILELLITRTLVLAPIYVLGFSKEVIDAYIVIVGFQAVFNHANVSVRLGPLRYLIVTPNFHHWHHSQDDEAIDRNYAAHFAFLDHLFGTAVQSDRDWPARYGVQGDYVPDGFLKQLKFPFVWKG